MTYDVETAPRIPYDEYRVITTLMHAHLRTHEKQLRALVAFGPLVTRGGTYDIDLLEVVDGWTGPTSVTFGSTPDLPLREFLRLTVVSTQDFEEPYLTGRGNARTERLLDKVLGHLQQGYEVVYENPFGCVENALAQADLATVDISPLTFLDNTTMRETAA